MSKLKKDQGILFLPNHPALVDPIILLNNLLRRFTVRPLVAEVQYKQRPKLFDIFDSLPVPDFGEGTNSYTKHLMEQVEKRTLETLEARGCILMYPAGRLMRTGTRFTEVGASATFDLVKKRRQEKPWRVVLVTIDGLWGSRFSTAYEGKTPNPIPELKSGLCDLFMSLFFFMPKRRVDITFEEVEVPEFEDKTELNKWLMSKYNAQPPETLAKRGEEGYRPGKGRVPSRCCSSKVKSVAKAKASAASDQQSSLDGLDAKVIQQVVTALAKHLGKAPGSLNLSDRLAEDLGMDSIQTGELLGWLDEEFNVQDVTAPELTTVASVVQVVAGNQGGADNAPKVRPPPEGWQVDGDRPGIEIKGDSLPEAFIINAKRMGKRVMAGDDLSGVLTYDKALIAAILFAKYLMARPTCLGDGRVGIMMPAAAGVGIIIMGVMLAGCSPVMVNWTVGRASLEHVLKQTKITTVITSQAFLKKLGPEVDLTCLLEKESLLLFTEDIKASFGSMAKLGGLRTAGKSASKLISMFKLKEKFKDRSSEAVVLFTSGSESAPKGVPLTHGNVLSNIDGMLEAANAKNTDCLFGVLPPFHSFGFTVTTMGPMVSGLRVAFYPNPTEYRRIAREVGRWRPTIYLGTPTFANGMFQAAKADFDRNVNAIAKGVSSSSLGAAAKKSANKVNPSPEAVWNTASVRLCVTGAEKTPDALYEFLEKTHKPKVELVEGYGITECSPVLTANRERRPRAGVGWAIKGTSLGLLEPDPYLAKEAKLFATVCDGKLDGPKEQRGIIIAKGPGVFGAPNAEPPTAYLGIPLTEKNPFFKLNGEWWYDTGDLGYFDDSGALYLAGRLKRFVKIAGEMISLVQLEAALKTKPAWSDVEAGPVIAVEAYESDDGSRPVLGLVHAVDASLEDANEHLQAQGMPRIAKLTIAVDARTVFDVRWAEQGTLPLLGTGKSDYASMKKAVVSAAKAAAAE